MKYFISILACLAMASCGGGGGDSEQTKAACSIIGLNTKIIGGEACSDLDRASIVRIMALVEVDNDLYPVPVCTGTMVTSDTVLTAQHCLITDFAGYPVRNLGIYSGEPGSGNLIAASLYLRAPGYRYEASVGRIFNDAALIKLRESSNLPSIPILLSRSVDIGETGYVYGYGATAENQDPNDVTFFDLEAGTMNIQNVTPNHIFVAFDGGSVNVCNGDSGGPLIVLVDGEPAIAG
ncbi:MAG: trypsin-like serine protease, partial [SAR324 cluster bacterium]|nr:trypsin-like serine protease [SAR324 cluster bacterium]